MQLDKPIERASGGDPLLLYKILHLLFFPLLWILCALHLESKKNYQHGLDVGPLQFQFFQLQECFTNPFTNLSLCFRITGKTPGPIACNNFVKNIFVCIGHCVNVLARCDSIFSLLRCHAAWNKSCTQLSLSQILFQNLKNYSLGDVQRFCHHSWCDLTSFLTKSATAAMFTSVWVNYGRPPLSSSSTSFLLSQNQEYHLETFDWFRASFPKHFATILVFLSQIDQVWHKILWQLSVHFCHPRCIKNTDLTRQVITRTLSKINKQNSVCEWMLVDST